MKNTVTLLLALAVAAVACHRSKARGPRYAESNEGGEEQSSRAASGPTTAAGTCGASCSHYLQCKANYDPGAHPACVTKCNQMGLSQQQMINYEATDCATAIWQAENTGGNGGTTGTGATPKSSECNGCVWDGSSCIWLSQSNWGAGPYSGAASSCNAACCPGH